MDTNTSIKRPSTNTSIKRPSTLPLVTSATNKVEMTRTFSTSEKIELLKRRKQLLQEELSKQSVNKSFYLKRDNQDPFLTAPQGSPTVPIKLLTTPSDINSPYQSTPFNHNDHLPSLMAVNTPSLSLKTPISEAVNGIVAVNVSSISSTVSNRVLLTTIEHKTTHVHKEGEFAKPWSSKSSSIRSNEKVNTAPIDLTEKDSPVEVKKQYQSVSLIGTYNMDSVSNIRNNNFSKLHQASRQSNVTNNTKLSESFSVRTSTLKGPICTIALNTTPTVSTVNGAKLLLNGDGKQLQAIQQQNFCGPQDNISSNKVVYYPLAQSLTTKAHHGVHTVSSSSSTNGQMISVTTKGALPTLTNTKLTISKISSHNNINTLPSQKSTLSPKSKISPTSAASTPQVVYGQLGFLAAVDGTKTSQAVLLIPGPTTSPLINTSPMLRPSNTLKVQQDKNISLPSSPKTPNQFIQLIPVTLPQSRILNTTVAPQAIQKVMMINMVNKTPTTKPLLLSFNQVAKNSMSGDSSPFKTITSIQTPSKIIPNVCKSQLVKSANISKMFINSTATSLSSSSNTSLSPPVDIINSTSFINLNNVICNRSPTPLKTQTKSAKNSYIELATSCHGLLKNSRIFGTTSDKNIQVGEPRRQRWKPTGSTGTMSTKTHPKPLLPINDSSGCARTNGLKPYERVETIYETSSCLVSPDTTDRTQMPVITGYKSLAVVPTQTKHPLTSISLTVSAQSNNSNSATLKTTNAAQAKTVSLISLSNILIPNVTTPGGEGKHLTVQSTQTNLQKSTVIDLTLEEDDAPNTIAQVPKDTVGIIRTDCRDPTVNTGKKLSKNKSNTDQTLAFLDACLKVSNVHSSTDNDPSFPVVSALDSMPMPKTRRDVKHESLKVPLKSSPELPTSLDKISRTLFALDRLSRNLKYRDTQHKKVQCIENLRELRDVLIIERNKQRLWMDERLYNFRQIAKNTPIVDNDNDKTPAQRLMEKFSLTKYTSLNTDKDSEVSTQKESRSSSSEVSRTKEKPKTFQEILEQQRQRKKMKQTVSSSLCENVPQVQLETFYEKPMQKQAKQMEVLRILALNKVKTPNKVKVTNASSVKYKDQSSTSVISSRNRIVVRKLANPKDPFASSEDRALQRALALSLKEANREKQLSPDAINKGEPKAPSIKIMKRSLGHNDKEAKPIKKKRPTEIDQLVDTHWNESWLKGISYTCTVLSL